MLSSMDSWLTCRMVRLGMSTARPVSVLLWMPPRSLRPSGSTAGKPRPQRKRKKEGERELPNCSFSLPCFGNLLQRFIQCCRSPPHSLVRSCYLLSLELELLHLHNCTCNTLTSPKRKKLWQKNAWFTLHREAHKAWALLFGAHIEQSRDSHLVHSGCGSVAKHERFYSVLIVMYSLVWVSSKDCQLLYFSSAVLHISYIQSAVCCRDTKAALEALEALEYGKPGLTRGELRTASSNDGWCWLLRRNWRPPLSTM